MRALLAFALLLPVHAHAQQAAPSAPAEQPPVKTAPESGPREDLRDDSGTTIVGERESPIGLYITPWRNAYAEQDIDRPARLLQVDMAPIDRDVFARQIEYYDALTEAKQAKSGASPAAPAIP